MMNSKRPSTRMKTSTAHQKMSVNNRSMAPAKSDRGRSELWGNGPPQAAPAAHRRGSSQRLSLHTASKVDESQHSVNERFRGWYLERPGSDPLGSLDGGEEGEEEDHPPAKATGRR